MIGIGEALLIGGAVFLIFGVSRLPKLGRSLGEGIKAFKEGLKEGERKENEKNDSPKSGFKE